MELIKRWQISLPIFTLLFFVIAMLLIFHISCEQLGLFLFCQVAMILIPGFAAVLLTNQKLPAVSTFCYSYIWGYVINIFEYFGVKHFEKCLPLYLVPLLILIFSLLVIFIKRKNIKNLFEFTPSINQTITLSFIAFLLVLNIFVYAIPKMDISVLFRDFNWWCNNTVSLKLMFPPEMAFASGFKLFYHYFSSVQIALFSLISGIDILTSSIPLYTLTKTIMMAGAVDFVLNTLNVTNPKIRIVGFILTLFVTGCEYMARVTQSWHILAMPIGYDIGYAFCIMYLAVFIKQFFETKFDIKLFVTTTIFWFICVGAKAPLASILLIFTGLSCLYWLINKQFIKSFGYGLTMLVSFLVVSYTFVGLGHVLDGSALWGLKTHTLLDYGANYISAIFTIILRFLVVNPTMLVLSVIATIVVIKTHDAHKIEKPCLALLSILGITSIIGIFMWFIIDAGGKSEMYNCMAAFILLYFYIFYSYELFTKNQNLFSDEQVRKFKVIAIIMLIFGATMFLVFPFAKKKHFYNHFYKGAVYLINYEKNMQNIAPLTLLRDKSNSDSIILSDNILTDRNDFWGTYYFSILTERRQYLDETNMLAMENEKIKEDVNNRLKLIKGVYSNNISDLKKLKELGINYVISQKDVTPHFNPSAQYLEPIMENDRMKLYKVK